MFSPDSLSFQNPDAFIPVTPVDPATPDTLWLDYIMQDYEGGELSAGEVLTLILESAP
jgi:hypothetical protein